MRTNEAWPRKLLLVTGPFYPSVGGVESVVLGLARTFVDSGYDVTVMTLEPGSGQDEFPYRVLRKPSPLRTWQEFAQANAIIQVGDGIRLGWPLLLRRFPVLTVHCIWGRPKHSESVTHQRLRTAIIRRSLNVCPSRAMANALDWPCEIIGFPYDENLFHIRAEIPRDRDVIFVGRLIPEKGADILIEALYQLSTREIRPTATIVGGGPELERLKQQAAEKHLQDQCLFRGWLVGEALVEELNRHRILVVPSRWEEPFGIVALEGIACGCVVVGSDGGGLPDAIGPCGFLFARDSADSLADCLHDVLRDKPKQTEARAQCIQHLRRFTRKAVADAYLEFLRRNFAPQRN